MVVSLDPTTTEPTEASGRATWAVHRSSESRIDLAISIFMADPSDQPWRPTMADLCWVVIMTHHANVLDDRYPAVIMSCFDTIAQNQYAMHNVQCSHKPSNH